MELAALLSCDKRFGVRFEEAAGRAVGGVTRNEVCISGAGVDENHLFEP